MAQRKMTPTQRRKMNELIATTAQTIFDLRHPALLVGHLPAAWAEIKAAPVPDRVRITLRVDADVAKFFRGLGRDYQRTMNDVLRSFMLARVTEVLPEPAEVEVKDDTDERTVLALEHEALLESELVRVRMGRLGVGPGSGAA